MGLLDKLKATQNGHNRNWLNKAPGVYIVELTALREFTTRDGKLSMVSEWKVIESENVKDIDGSETTALKPGSVGAIMNQKDDFYDREQKDLVCALVGMNPSTFDAEVEALASDPARKADFAEFSELIEGVIARKESDSSNMVGTRLGLSMIPRLTRKKARVVTPVWRVLMEAESAPF